MTATAPLVCITCQNIFRSRSDLNNHVKRDHQTLVKVQFQDGRVTEVERGDDDKFKCKCGKCFRLPDSLRRHAKSCRSDVTRSEEDEEVVMRLSEQDSEGSESSDFNGEGADETPIDCYGALISREIG
jgi:hypothetical protein